jgi:hypothetical protein
LNSLQRGLLALTLICIGMTPLSAANYLYKDEVIHNKKFTNLVNNMGSELFKKTGIALRLVVLKKLDNNQTIVDYEKNLVSTFHEPTILLTFSEMNKKVDILARPQSLYKYFDKKQVLSPAASFLDALYLSLFYSKNFDQFKENIQNYGGTIIPLLAQKTKEYQNDSKYSAALFNGYADIASQVAKSKHVKLKTAIGNANRDTLDVLRIIFYVVLLYGVYLYIKKRLRMRELKNENR